MAVLATIAGAASESAALLASSLLPLNPALSRQAGRGRKYSGRACAVMTNGEGDAKNPDAMALAAIAVNHQFDSCQRKSYNDLRGF
jgi:hypothetical protein